jgi:hypothetical protein
VCDVTNRVYYFKSTTSPNIIWVRLDVLEFSSGASVKKIDLANRRDRIGDVSSESPKPVIITCTFSTQLQEGENIQSPPEFFYCKSHSNAKLLVRTLAETIHTVLWLQMINKEKPLGITTLIGLSIIPKRMLMTSNSFVHPYSDANKIEEVPFKSIGVFMHRQTT